MEIMEIELPRKEFEKSKNFIENIIELEEKYGGEAITVEVIEDKVIVKMICSKVPRKKAHLHVWDCKATFFLNGKAIDEDNLTEGQKEALEDLKMKIFMKNRGGISRSGVYFLDREDFEELRKILS